jgi:hypothetical protein
MYCTHHLVRVLAPLALVGGIATNTPLAQAATAAPTSAVAAQSVVPSCPPPWFCTPFPPAPKGPAPLPIPYPL